MGRKRTKPKDKPTEEKTETGGVKFYKHRFMNCHLTLNSSEVATGARSISILLRKGKDDEYGIFDTKDEQIQKLIPQHSLFGKMIFEITKEQSLGIPKKEIQQTYHRGVVGALTKKARR